jgi:hypothetical protein
MTTRARTTTRQNVVGAIAALRQGAPRRVFIVSSRFHRSFTHPGVVRESYSADYVVPRDLCVPELKGRRMPTWLSLMIIVLVSVALFADHRRNRVERSPDMTWDDEFPIAALDPLFRPNVRGGSLNGHPAGVARPFPRRAGQDVRKRR